MDRKEIARCIGVCSGLQESLKIMQLDYLPANSTLLSRSETKASHLKELLFELYEETILSAKLEKEGK